MSFFDPVSFALGMGVGAGVGGGAVYVLKGRKSRKEDGDIEDLTSSESARQFILPSASRRYLEDLVTFFQRAHLPRDMVRLTDVLVEPRFLRNQSPILKIEKDESGLIIDTNINRVIPFLHQYPALYASFNLETISLNDLETGNRHIAILGVPGSGKSTALAALGLVALGELNVDDIKVVSHSEFADEDEDPDLPAEVRERRHKEREELQRKAIQQLRVVQSREEEMSEVEQLDEAIDFDKLFPVYVHVRHINLDPAHYGGTIDPLEPIVDALPHYVNSNTATVTPPLIYRMIRRGEALILIDGYDDLLPPEQETYYYWLESLLKYYGNNYIVIAGQESGYDPLVNLGFAPTFISPFNEVRSSALISRWMDAWANTANNQPGEKERRLITVDNRNRTLIDICMKIWAALVGDIKEPGRRGYYDSYIRQQVGEIPHGMAILQDVAVFWLNTGKAPNHDQLLKLAQRHFDESGGEDDGKKKSSKSSGEADKAVKQLAALDMLYNLPDGSLAFRHSYLGWYLAGSSLKNANQQRLEEVSVQPYWNGGLSFASSIVDLEPTVLKRLQAIQDSPDLLYNGIFSVTHWMPDAPDSVRWKKEILKRLRGVLLAPNQFPLVREYALAAMVTSRDPGTAYIFREAVRSGNAHIRMLGCLGVGALGSDEAVSDLNPMLFDEVVEVQLAAGLALGAIGSEDALTVLVQALLDGNEQLQQAVAEALSSIEGEGHAVLRDAITSDNLMVRRASTYGLAKVPETWALVALYKTMLEDSQWAVRAAAERAFQQAREPRRSGPRLYPEPEHYLWLVDWAADRGEAVPEGLGGRQTLMKALESAPLEVRLESIKALGQLGHLRAVKALYGVLGDQESAVRTLAFNSLGKMSERFGQPLPGI